MGFAVLKGAAYALIHAPDMVLHNGTTQTVEMEANPNSTYLEEVKKNLRSYEAVVDYAPNQAYIGNIHPEELKTMLDKDGYFIGTKTGGNSNGKRGTIMREDDFVFMMKLSDAFDLVILEKDFSNKLKARYIEAESKYRAKEDIEKELTAKVKEGHDLADIKNLVEKEHSEGLYYDGKLVGCVKRAHDVDVALSSHVMFENLVVKASGVVAFKELIRKNNIDVNSIDLVIECSEEACGDMNQRGGGNFAKSIAEMTHCMNATGYDIRGFCAAPTHSFVTAASLVKAGTYKNVVIVAGGASAKLGMNSKSHIKKNLPILEDVLGAFACLVSVNDGVSPVIRTDLVGRHTVQAGSAPQAVMNALVVEPLKKAGIKIVEICKYSVEMQNPDITKPAGAGDVPEANYKMIAAMAVKEGEIERDKLMQFVDRHGMVGFAPTQGHIPSGVPYLGFAIDDINAGKVDRAMIIGKGSLFLGRMTNLFDGISVVIEKNSGEKSSGSEGGVSKEEINKIIASAMKDFAKKILE